MGKLESTITFEEGELAPCNGERARVGTNRKPKVRAIGRARL